MAKPILVVDDSSLSRRKIMEHCKSFGFDTEALSGANQVMARLEQGEPVALILLDLHMPGMSGDELLDELSSLEKAPKVVVITADLQKTTVQLCLEKGAHCVLNKPVDPEKLKYVIDKLMEEDS